MFKESKYNIKVKNSKENRDLMYNSLTKAYIEMCPSVSFKEITDKLNNGIDTTNELEDYKDLIENGFIVDNDFNEIDGFEFLYRKNFFNNSQLNIILVPTLACNFACPYCFEEPNRDMEVNPNYFKSLSLYAKRYFKWYKHVEVSLFGGEPLLMTEQLFDYLTFVRELSNQENFSYSCSITTNGSLLTKEIVENLVKNNCQTLQITIDGSKYTHDNTRCYKDGSPSFEHLMGIINDILQQYILDEKIKFILRINLNNNTIQDIEDTLLCINEEIRSKIPLVLRPVYQTSEYSEENKNKLELLQEFYDMAQGMNFPIMKNRYDYRSCEACGDENFFYITPDLGIWKCINTMSIEQAKIGYINNEGELKFNSDNIVNWYKAADCFSDENCKECKMLPDCLGGCILYKVSHDKRKCSPFELVSLPYYYD